MSVADTDSWVNINTVLKHALRNNVSVWIDYMVLRFPYKMRQEYSERHKTYQTFIRESFVPEFLARLHGNDHDFSDKYLLSLGMVRDACEKVAKQYPDVVRDVKTKTVHVLAVHKSALGIVAIEVRRRMAARSKRQFERGGGKVRAAGKMQDAKKRKISTQHTI